MATNDSLEGASLSELPIAKNVLAVIFFWHDPEGPATNTLWPDDPSGGRPPPRLSKYLVEALRN